MPSLLSLPIRYRLSLAISAAMLIIAVAMLFIGQQLYQLRDRDYQQNYVANQLNLWNAISANQATEMAANFKVFTRDRKLKTALFRKKFDGIRELVGPIATRLKAEKIADNMQIVAQNGQVVFSEIPSASQATQTALQVLQSRQQQTDIDFSPDGRVVIVVAVPILDRSDLVGVGVFERELHDTVERIKDANQNEILILDQNNSIQAATLQQPAPLSSVQTAHYLERNQNGIIEGIARVPLKNQSGEIVATLMTFEDVTAAAQERQKTWAFAAIMVVALVLLAAIGTFLYVKRSLSPLNRSVEYIEKIAEGDLSLTIQCNREDEFRRLLDAMLRMNEDLRRLVGNVSSAVAQVLQTVSQVKHASEKTDQDIAQQYASLQQLSVSVSQMAETSRHVTQNISELEHSAEHSASASQEGDQLVKDSVRNINNLTDAIRSGGQTIQNLETKSREIGVVLEVIKNIAEQTNLLALNAAIEAARAGESGRGFAVVADEVRTLAARTQESTIEIEEIIRAVQDGVSQAVNVMDHSVDQASEVSQQATTISDALDSINAKISHISSLSTEVHSASDQQRSATEHMNDSIQVLSQKADSTASHAKEFSASVTQLQAVSQQLDAQMKHFQL